MFIVELIETGDDQGIKLLSRDDWDIQVEVQFLTSVKALDNPLSIHSIYMNHSSGQEFGYWGTLPLRGVKGTVSLDKGHKVRLTVNVYDELKKHDPVKFACLTSGTATIQIKGAVWLADEPPREFTLKRDIVLI